MFERYDVEDLYLASITVKYPECMICDGEIVDAFPEINCGGMLLSAPVGYGYCTIVYKDKETGKLLDLSNKKAVLNQHNFFEDSYYVENMEPLSKYYNQDGTKKLGKRKALKIGDKHYDDFRRKSE